ncbi:hypothetical protein FRZ06_11300 [Anoxybacterium hadale]|uniref:Uncharacterized protein n=1 Tax=Anoxybacterium hadale TaxID=3408580 RepID=A0ACD1AC36_9FIRM|nr:hypothetical protein FRZ06_11300 [Clostridiales bacterium]
MMMKRKYIAEDYPNITKEYLKEKNVIPVEEIYVSYPLPVWWRCEKGHEWKAKVKDRTHNKHGCIYCTKQVPLVGENDLATTDPILASEWHPTKNGDLTPQMVSRGSGKKVWWECKKGHEWEAAAYSRVSGHNCPYCSGRFPIRGQNDFETLHKDLALEWHPTKNGKLKPYEVKEKSNKRVWWLCNEGHEWEDMVYDRVVHNKQCPYCNNSFVVPDVNSFKALEPEAASYWDYEKNGDLKPDNYLPFSNQKMHWTCGKHEWYEPIGSMTKRKACPFCFGTRISKENSAIYKHPKLLSEFDYEKNVGINPDNISEGSNKMLWWKCKKGHCWLAPTERRVKGSGCPYCSGKRSIFSV